MSQPQVTAIVLNWNRKHLLKQCFDSLKQQTYSNLSLMMVDNASEDGSVEFVQEHYPEVEIIRNDENLGFTGGNNVGIRNCRTDFLALINNDTELHPRCIEEMVTTIQKDEKCGSIATKIFLEHDRSLLDAAGILVCKDGLAIGRGRMEDGSVYEEEAEVFFASDCVCLYRKSMLDDIGLYDEDFFAYAEETDLGWRARLRGWKTVYNPKAIVYHKHSASSSSEYAPFKVFLVERNRWWVAFKNLPTRYLVFGFWYTLRRYFYQAFGAFSGKGAAGKFAKEVSKFQLAWILIKANAAAIWGVPGMLKKRKQIQRSRLISTEDVHQLFEEFGMTPQEIAFKC